MEFSDEINNMHPDDLWCQGTLEMSNGSYSEPTTFCGLCWLKLKEETPGERTIDWRMWKDDIEDILSSLDYYNMDKTHIDYIFLQNKLIEAKVYETGLIKDGKTYSDLELSALYLTPVGNRLEIPQSFTIGNYKDLKAMMSNFDGKYKKNGFDFPYPAIQVLERISNQETTNLKKKFQFFGTPSSLCNELCDITFDPMLNKKVKVLEPEAGQGAIIEAILKWFEDKAVNIQLDELTAIEFMKENYQYLENNFNTDEVGMELYHMDFLEYDEVINYFDYVIANPPFTKGQDIDHFYKMYEVCKPGGTVTSIMSTGWIHNSNKKNKEFRAWLGVPEGADWRAQVMRKEAAKGHSDYTGVRQSPYSKNNETVMIKTYEAGAFKESGTNVITCVIQITKNDVSGFVENEQMSMF